MITGLKPFINISPGQILKREMESLNWSIEDFSEKSGMSINQIKDIISNKQSIDNNLVLLLGKTFNVSPDLWLNLEENYRLRKKH